MTLRPLLRGFLCLLALPGFPAALSAGPAGRFIDDAAIKADFETHLGALFHAGGLPAASSLAEQLRKAATAPLPPPLQAGLESPAPDDAVDRARNATLVLGHLFLCGKCDKYHGNVAGGVVISPDGLVLTNYHVMDAKEAVVFGAMTLDGQIYGIAEVLAASKADDVALVKLLDARDLPCVPLRPTVEAGDELFVVSHPDGHFYTLTRGYLARKYLIPKQRVPRLQITADFAKGSSGSGIFNVRGELIGLATSTNSIYYTEKNGVKDNLQMVVKSGVPVESILKLFSKAPPP
jgi:serine protease Do